MTGIVRTTRIRNDGWWRWTGAFALVGCVLWAACGDGAVEPASPRVTGGLRLISVTAGRNLDPDGYLVAVDGGAAQSIGVNDTVPVTGLDEGLHSVVLSGSRANCYPFPASSVDVVVLAGDTKDALLEVECLSMPNDLTLTFERRDGIRPVVNLAGMGAATGAPEPLTFRPGIDIAPDWSPDGTRLAWSRDGVIHIVNADGTGLRSFGTRGQGTNPAWSPDGSLIAYDNGSNVLVFEPDGSGETVIGAGIQPSWSPDGTRLAVEIEGATAFEGDIVVMNSDGSGVVNVTHAPVLLDREPTWSPDGTRIAFRRLDRTETSGYDLWVIDVDGGNAVKILELAGPQLNPRWLPDNRILFDHDRGIWVIDLDAGGALTEVSRESCCWHSHSTVRD